MKTFRIIYLLFIFSLITSCKKEIKSINKMSYERQIIRILESENTRKDIEIYISELGDTISNQIKVYSNNKLDSTKSFFYELKTEKSNIKNEFKGKLKFNSPIDFEKSKKKESRIYFSFKEESKDSIFLTNIELNDSNTIDFNYTNIKNDNIYGVLIKYTNIDTIIENKEMVRMIEERILIDNSIKSENFYIVPYEFNNDNKFSVKGLKIIND